MKEIQHALYLITKTNINIIQFKGHFTAEIPFFYTLNTCSKYIKKRSGRKTWHHTHLNRISWQDTEYSIFTSKVWGRKSQNLPRLFLNRGGCYRADWEKCIKCCPGLGNSRSCREEITVLSCWISDRWIDLSCSMLYCSFLSSQPYSAIVTYCVLWSTLSYSSNTDFYNVPSVLLTWSLELFLHLGDSKAPSQMLKSPNLKSPVPSTGNTVYYLQTGI